MWSVLCTGIHSLTRCTTGALQCYVPTTYFQQPPPSRIPVMMHDHDADVEMHDATERTTAAMEANDVWKKPAPRSSSRKRPATDGGTKSDKRSATSTTAPKIPIRKKPKRRSAAPVDGTTATTTSEVVTATSDDAAMVASPIIAQRDIMTDHADLAYTIVCEIHDSDGVVFKTPRHVVVCSREESTSGHIDNFLTNEGLMATNQFASSAADPIWDDEPAAWMEPAGDDSESISIDIGPTLYDAYLELYGVYEFGTPAKIQRAGFVVSVIFILAYTSEQAHLLAERALAALEATDNRYKLMKLDREDGAIAWFPPQQ